MRQGSRLTFITSPDSGSKGISRACRPSVSDYLIVREGPASVYVQARFTLLTTRDAVLPRLVTCMMTVRTSLPLGGCAPGPAPSLAEDPHLVARRQPLQSGRGDGMGRRPRCRIHFRPRRQCRARRPGGGDRCQSALHHAMKQQGEAAHLCEVRVSGRELEARRVVARLECSLQSGERACARRSTSVTS